MIRAREIPVGLVDAQGGLWIGGRCVGTMRRFEAAQPRPTPVQALRALLEAQIEAAIAALDALDGDPDLEPTGDDEPSLCGVTVNTIGNAGADDDRETECEDEGAACEDEGFDCDREPDVDVIGPGQNGPASAARRYRPNSSPAGTAARNTDLRAPPPTRRGFPFCRVLAVIVIPPPRSYFLAGSPALRT